MAPLARFSMIVLALVLLAGCNAPAGEQMECPGDGESAPIDAARLYIEYNATDGDLGVHGGFDGAGWSELCVFAPDGTQILGVKPDGQLGDLAVGGFFFESREPEVAELGFEELFAAFPEGQYQVRAQSFDGQLLTGAATFTHSVPAAPAISTPPLAEDEESAGEASVQTTGLLVTWQEVTQTVDVGPVTITSYEVIITRVGDEDPHGYSTPVFDVHLPPDRTSLSVPVEFLEPRTVYELELLALEQSGNQTISVGFFRTE